MTYFKKYWDENILNQWGSTRVNIWNPRPGLWNWNNLIKSKSKQIMKLNFQLIQCWMIKLKKKSIKKKNKRQTTRLNLG